MPVISIYLPLQLLLRIYIYISPVPCTIVVHYTLFTLLLTKHQGCKKRGKATAEMGGLREEGHEKVGGG